MKRFSPTTVLPYFRLFATIAICGRPVWDYWTVTNYNAVSEAAGAAAISALVNSVISVVAGHFTADAKPNSKV